MRWPGSTVTTLLIVAVVCFAVVVVAHVFERYQLLMFMGWGRPSSVGHYIDLTAAVLGVACVIVAGLIAVVRWPRAR